MESKKGREKRYYRLYGCKFTEEEYDFLGEVLNKIKKNSEERLSNTRILLEAFKSALKERGNEV